MGGPKKRRSAGRSARAGEHLGQVIDDAGRSHPVETDPRALEIAAVTGEPIRVVVGRALDLGLATLAAELDPNAGGTLAVAPMLPGAGDRSIPLATRARILAMAEQGESPGRIARALDAAGVPTPRGGSSWQRSTVRKALDRWTGGRPR